MTFEEACEYVRITAEELTEFGIEGCRKLLAERASVAGWTVTELANESAKRVKERILELEGKA